MRGGGGAAALGRGVRAAYDGLIALLAALAAVSVGAIFVLIIFSVTARDLGYALPSFTTAVVEYLLLYMTMFAAPYLVRRKGHVYIDVLAQRLPQGLDRMLAGLAYVISIACSLVIAFFALELFISAWRAGTFEERGIDMPLWLLYLPIPIGFLAVAVEFGRYLFGADTMYGDRSEPKETL